MLDGGRIAGGAVILLVLAAGPAWVASVRSASVGTPPLAAVQAPCIEPRATMLREHPRILADWRQQAVRSGIRLHAVSGGREVHGSLSGTCLGCHGPAEGFCNRCHATVGVSLNCWSCHKDAPSGSPLFVDDLRFAQFSR